MRLREVTNTGEITYFAVEACNATGQPVRFDHQLYEALDVDRWLSERGVARGKRQAAMTYRLPEPPAIAREA